MAVVDVYDALVNSRPYKHALTLDETRDILYEEIEKGWWLRTVVDLLFSLSER